MGTLQVQLTHGDQYAGKEVERETLQLVGGFTVLTHAGLTRAGFLAFYSHRLSCVAEVKRLPMTLNPADSAGMTQLVRYVLTIDNMRAPECVVWVREQLTGLGLIVDRVAVGEAEVATAHANGPDLKAIQAVLEAGGYQLVRSVTKVG